MADRSGKAGDPFHRDDAAEDAKQDRAEDAGEEGVADERDVG